VKILVDALHSKGMAMVKKLQLKPQPRVEEIEQFTAHVKLMKKWITTMETDSKYFHINLMNEKVNNQLGSALSLVRKHLTTNSVSCLFFHFNFETGNNSEMYKSFIVDIRCSPKKAMTS
jgi:hypothetical protein